MTVTVPIAEDFAAIHARLLAIRDAERSWMVAPQPEPDPASPQEGAPGDFYGWLIGGQLWSGR